jgi:hypothetical protein
MLGLPEFDADEANGGGLVVMQRSAGTAPTVVAVDLPVASGLGWGWDNLVKTDFFRLGCFF